MVYAASFLHLSLMVIQFSFQLPAAVMVNLLLILMMMVTIGQQREARLIPLLYLSLNQVFRLAVFTLGITVEQCAGFVREGRILSVFYEKNKNNSFGCIGNHDSFLQ